MTWMMEMMGMTCQETTTSFLAAFRLDPERYFLHAASVQTGQAASEPKKVRLKSTEFWGFYMTPYMTP